jgi:hypothetical protein
VSVWADVPRRYLTLPYLGVLHTDGSIETGLQCRYRDVKHKPDVRPLPALCFQLCALPVPALDIRYLNHAIDTLLELNLQRFSP